MLQDTESTIFALSTPYARGAIGIIRVSGTLCCEVISRMCRLNPADVKSREATLVTIHSLRGDDILDFALCIYFRAPNSYTGEDLLELHVHGGIAVINDIMRELSEMNGLRLAEKGEFTKRALLNNRIDIIKAEAIGDLIHADTSMQRRIITRQMSSNTISIYEQWRENLLVAMAQFEAYIDFPDEDIPTDRVNDLLSDLRRLEESVKKQLNIANTAQNLMAGLKVVICGIPNAGKSSLMNLVAREDVAIVSDIAGTTRDVIRTRLNIDGYLILLFDTAGLRGDAESKIELEGIGRARNEIIDADIRIIMLSLEEDIATQMKELHIESAKNDIFLLNKYDAYAERYELAESTLANDYDVDSESIMKFSCRNSEGFIDDLLLQLQKKIKNVLPNTEDAISINERQRQCLKNCLQHLRELNSVERDIAAMEIFAHHLRLAASALEFLIGGIDTNDILNKIFSSFCIGK